jgi:hypothetical protein
MGGRAGGSGTGFGSRSGGPISNVISRTNDDGIYVDAFDNAYSDIDEDYSISMDYGDMEKTFADLGKTETVNVDNIVSPQATLDSKTVNKYMKAKKFDGAYGVKFQGSDEVMVVDGNHRIGAAIKSGKSTVNMKVITIEN